MEEKTTNLSPSREPTRFGEIPLTIKFKSKGSYDPDDHPLTYLWDFGDGVTSNLANPTHTFNKEGVFYALLTVRDSKGSSAYARSIRINAGNLAPTATILSPAEGTKVRPGQNVFFSGEATDPEDGTIPPERMFWSAVLQSTSFSRNRRMHLTEVISQTEVYLL